MKKSYFGSINKKPIISLDDTISRISQISKIKKYGSLFASSVALIGFLYIGSSDYNLRIFSSHDLSKMYSSFDIDIYYSNIKSPIYSFEVSGLEQIAENSRFPSRPLPTIRYEPLDRNRTIPTDNLQIPEDEDNPDNKEQRRYKEQKHQNGWIMNG